MSAPPEVYESVFKAVIGGYGFQPSSRESALIGIGLDHAWDAAVDRVRVVIDSEVLQQVQDGGIAEATVVLATDVEKALGLGE